MTFSIDRTNARNESSHQPIHAFLFFQLSNSSLNSLLNRIAFRFSRCETRHDTSTTTNQKQPRTTPHTSKSFINEDPLLASLTSRHKQATRCRSPTHQQRLSDTDLTPPHVAVGEPQSSPKICTIPSPSHYRKRHGTPLFSAIPSHQSVH